MKVVGNSVIALSDDSPLRKPFQLSALFAIESRELRMTVHHAENVLLMAKRWSGQPIFRTSRQLFCMPTPVEPFGRPRS